METLSSRTEIGVGIVCVVKAAVTTGINIPGGIGWLDGIDNLYYNFITYHLEGMEQHLFRDQCSVDSFCML